MFPLLVLPEGALVVVGRATSVGAHVGPGLDVDVHHVDVDFVPRHEALAAQFAVIWLLGVGPVHYQLVRRQLLLVLAYRCALQGEDEFIPSADIAFYCSISIFAKLSGR